MGSGLPVNFAFLVSNRFTLTLERRMESKTPRSDQKIAKESDAENSIMAILPTIDHAFEGQVDEEEVRQGVDYLCGVSRGIIVLPDVRRVCGELG